MKAVIYKNNQFTEDGLINKCYKIFDVSQIQCIYPATHSTINILLNNGEEIICRNVELYQDNDDLSDFEECYE